MLSKEDLNLILEGVNSIEKIERKFLDNLEIKTLHFNNLIEKEFDISYIDSSFVHGIVGPYVYIYARAVCVSKENLNIVKDFLILPDTFYLVLDYKEGNYAKLDVDDIGEIVSKSLEYKLASKAKTEYIMIDGSLLSDLILYDKSYNILEEKIMKRYREFRESFFRVFKENTFSIAKRILHAHFITNNEKLSDFIILLNKFPVEEFYTEVYIKDLSLKIKSLNKSIKALYFRPRYGDHIYRLETVEDTDDNTIREIVYNLIYKNKKYPFGLKLAHNKSKITNKEKFLVEQSLKKILGYDKTISWETK